MNPRTTKDSLEDQSTLLILLHKLKERGFETKRLKLQKLVYLADVFGTVLEKKPTTYTFRVYKHGPFSAEIYADIERLVSVGLARAKEMEKWTPEQERSFNYTITRSGVERIEKILEIPEFVLKERAIELALQVAGHLSGTKIRRLVYSEPNYMKARKKGFGSKISPNYEFASKFREIAETVACEEYGLVLSGNEVSWLYTHLMREIQSEPQTVEA